MSKHTLLLYAYGFIIASALTLLVVIVPSFIKEIRKKKHIPWYERSPGGLVTPMGGYEKPRYCGPECRCDE